MSGQLPEGVKDEPIQALVESTIEAGSKDVESLGLVTFIDPLTGDHAYGFAYNRTDREYQVGETVQLIVLDCIGVLTYYVAPSATRLMYGPMDPDCPVPVDSGTQLEYLLCTEE